MRAKARALSEPTTASPASTRRARLRSARSTEFSSWRAISYVTGWSRHRSITECRALKMGRIGGENVIPASKLIFEAPYFVLRLIGDDRMRYRAKRPTPDSPGGFLRLLRSGRARS